MTADMTVTSARAGARAAYCARSTWPCFCRMSRLGTDRKALHDRHRLRQRQRRGLWLRPMRPWCRYWRCRRASWLIGGAGGVSFLSPSRHSSSAVVVGGLSPNVAVYIVAALFLGVFSRCNRAPLGRSPMTPSWKRPATATVFERTIGRVRFAESAGLVVSALAGGVLAEVVPLRATYFMTVPFTSSPPSPCCAFGNRSCTRPRRPGRCERKSPPPIGHFWNGALCAR